MTLRTKTFAVITGFALIPLVFTISVFLINQHIDLGNSSIEQRFIISRWLEVEFYPAVYQNELNRIKIPDGIEICLVNNMGIVAYSNTSRISTGEFFGLAYPRFYETLRGSDGRTLIESFMLNGRRWHLFMGYGKIPAELEKKKFFILVKALQFTFFIIAVGTVLGSIFVGSILKSVRKLEAAVKKIADGNLDFRLESAGNDEFAMLNASFEKMRQALREEQARKSRFLMAVSHDLKTPLTSIKGYLEAISDGLASDTQAQKKYLGIISDKASVLEERISDLISFAAMETGECRLRKKKIRLRSFLDSLSIIYREDCEIMGKVFLYENSIPGDLEISCDPVLFERALENHFTNSLRYTFDGAEISLRCYPDHASDGIPVIEVADNGDGIDEKDLKYIFEPFYRGSSSRREPGMGLGLSTSMSVFQSHGWSVGVSSAKGKGTVFTILLKPQD